MRRELTTRPVVSLLVFLAAGASTAGAARLADLVGGSPLNMPLSETRAKVERAGYSLAVTLVDNPGFAGRITRYDVSDRPSGGTFAVNVGAVPVPLFEGSSMAECHGKVQDLRKYGITVDAVQVALPVGQTDGVGMVRSQDPDAGVLVTSGGKVTLYVYRAGASGHVDIPAVVGFARDVAEGVLQRRGFVVELRPDVTDDPKLIGAVTRTEPTPKTNAPKGSKVVIYYGVEKKASIPQPTKRELPDAKPKTETPPRQVAEPRAPVAAQKTEVPGVLGMSVARATSLLRDAGLVVMERYVLVEAPSDTETVYKTEPAPGAMTMRGDTVVLFRHRPRTRPSPPVNVAMPSVVGMNQRDANGALEKLGLKVTVGAVPVGSTESVGVVVSQWPAVGQPANSSSKVKLTVGRKRRSSAVAPILVGAGLIAVLIFGGLLIRQRPRVDAADVDWEKAEGEQGADAGVHVEQDDDDSAIVIEPRGFGPPPPESAVPEPAAALEQTEVIRPAQTSVREVRSPKTPHVASTGTERLSTPAVATGRTPPNKVGPETVEPDAASPPWTARTALASLIALKEQYGKLKSSGSAAERIGFFQRLGACSMSISGTYRGTGVEALDAAPVRNGYFWFVPVRDEWYMVPAFDSNVRQVKACFVLGEGLMHDEWRLAEPAQLTRRERVRDGKRQDEWVLKSLGRVEPVHNPGPAPAPASLVVPSPAEVAHVDPAGQKQPPRQAAPRLDTPSKHELLRIARLVNGIAGQFGMGSQERAMLARRYGAYLEVARSATKRRGDVRPTSGAVRPEDEPDSGDLAARLDRLLAVHSAAFMVPILDIARSGGSAGPGHLRKQLLEALRLVEIRPKVGSLVLSRQDFDVVAETGTGSEIRVASVRLSGYRQRHSREIIRLPQVVIERIDGDVNPPDGSSKPVAASDTASRGRKLPSVPSPSLTHKPKLELDEFAADDMVAAYNDAVAKEDARPFLRHHDTTRLALAEREAGATGADPDVLLLHASDGGCFLLAEGVGRSLLFPRFTPDPHEMIDVLECFDLEGRPHPLASGKYRMMVRRPGVCRKTHKGWELASKGALRFR